MNLFRILCIGNPGWSEEEQKQFNTFSELTILEDDQVVDQLQKKVTAFSQDIILITCNLHTASVLSILASVKNQTPFVPVVVIEGKNDIGIAVKYMKAGAADYFTIDQRSELVSRIEAFLTNNRTSQHEYVNIPVAPSQKLGWSTFFAHILDQHPVQMSIIDLDGKYLYVNPACIKDEKLRYWIIGKNDMAYYKKRKLPPGNAKQRFSAIQTCIETKENTSFIEPFPAYDGLRWIIRSYSPFLDTEGNVQHVIGYSTDLTEQKQAEDLLRASEEKYRMLYEANPTMYFTMDKNGVVIAVNQFGAEHLGYTKAELVGDSVLKVFYEPDVENVKIQFQKCLDNPSVTFQWQFRKVQKNGNIMWVEEFARAVKGPDGELIVLVVCEDINKRKKVEAALKEKERQYRNIFEAVTDGLVIADTSEIIVEANPAACKMYGYDYETLIGKSISDLVHPDYLLTYEKAVEKCRTEHQFFCETVELRKDGSAFPVEVHGSCIMYKGSIHMLTVVRDITERKQNEENIRKNEKMLETAQAMAHMGSFEWDIQNNEVTWSDELYRIYGLEPQVFGASFEAFLEYIHPDDRENVRSRIEQCLITHEPFEMEERIIRQDNEVRILATKGELILNKDTNRPVRLVGACQDITDRVQAEEKRRELEQQIQHTQKLESLGVLAGGIAHDFNNILTGILGNAGLALMELSPRSAIYSNVENVEKAARRAAELCRQLLAYSGKGDFVIKPLNMNDIVKELTQLFDVSIARKAALHYELEEALPSIKGDVTQIHQVVMNLITNASDAIEGTHGSITIRTGCMTCDETYLSETYLDDHLPAGEYVFIEVRDTGIGMDKETQQKIFDPFFTTKFTGRGLGLAALLGIVRSHKGAIEVESELGKGTTVRVFFPKSGSFANAPQLANNNRNLYWKGSGTILVVDDEDIVREIGKKSLESAGFKVITAIDGLEAVEIFREQYNDILLVLLDMTMPYMNGEETYEHLKQIRKDVKVIFSSGFRENEAKMHLNGNGNTEFIPKPYHPVQLIEKVRKILVNETHIDR